MRTIVSAKRKHIATPEPIDVGGTSASTALAATTALEGVSNTQMDVASGNAILDDNSKVKTENIPNLPTTLDPTVMRPAISMEMDARMDCVITNYDINQAYDISLIVPSLATGENIGTVVLQTFDHMIDELEAYGQYNFNDTTLGQDLNPGSVKTAGTISYHAPASPGIGGFTLNGKQYPITINAPYVPIPAIVSPDPNSVCAHPVITVIANAQYYWRFGYAVSIQFQISESMDFSTVLDDYIDSDIQGGNFVHVFTGLQTNKLHYLRIKAAYSGTSVGVNGSLWSDWGPAISFATPAAFSLTEFQKISPTALNPGWPWSMDFHGDVLVIGTANARMIPNGNWYGDVDIYIKDNTAQALSYVYVTSVSKVVPTDTPVIIESDSAAFYHRYINAHVGRNVCLSKNNNYIFASAPGYTDLVANGISGSGAIVIFTTDNGSTDWGNELVHLTTLEPSPLLYTDPFNTGNPGSPFTTGFGWNISISQSDPIIYFAVTNSYDRVIVYKLDTTTNTITLMDTLVSPEMPVNTFNQFGQFTAFSDDGQVLVVSCSQGYDLIDQNNQQPIICGAAFIYRRTGNTWTLEQKLLPADTTIAWKFFGNNVAISRDGQEIFVGNDDGDGSHIYVYHNNGSNQWVLTQTITPALWSTSYGYMDSVAFSLDDTQVIVGSRAFDGGRGQFIIMKKINGIWTETERGTASDAVGSSWFGADVAMSEDGLTYMVAASLQNQGVYVFA